MLIMFIGLLATKHVIKIAPRVRLQAEARGLSTRIITGFNSANNAAITLQKCRISKIKYRILKIIYCLLPTIY